MTPQEDRPLNFSPAALRQRLLSPRVVIYAILAIAAAWLMHRHGQYAAQQKAPVDKTPAAIVENSASPLPMLVVIPDHKENQYDDLVAGATRRYKGKCQVTLLNYDGTPEDIMRLFKVAKLPALILYNPQNQELRRIEGSATRQDIDQILSDIH